jgi:DNA-binding IclR family transcriptional regulator
MPIARDLEILRGVADASDTGGIGVVALAAALGRDKSQVSRALRTLTAAGLLERDPDSARYHLGLELYGLAARTAESRLWRCAPAVLGSLAIELDETVHLCALHGRDVLTLRSQPPPTHAFRATGWEGRIVPAYATSAGRVLLGDHRPDELRRLFAGVEVRAPGPRARVGDVEGLIAAVALARRRGYATVREELEPGLVGAAAPARDLRGEIVAAINVSAEASRLHDLQAAGVACASAAARLSRLLGAAGAEPSSRPS